jgi:bifunctional DNase/RNase
MAKEDRVIPMHVIDLCSCPQSESPMVLLEDERSARWLAFYLPMNEANRLARALGRTHGPVPIFDLTEDLARRLGAALVRAEIHGDERGVRATLIYDRAGDELSFDCHAGDALALAIRAATPILAAETPLAHACRVNGELRKHAVRRWLAVVSPADFAKAADPRGDREEWP